LKQISGKNLILIGFMGTGKTEVGRLLAESLNRRLADTDQIVTEREGLSVRNIFAGRGEAYFRRREAEVVAELSAQKGLVVATGGGVVLDRENVRLLKENGFLVWLDADVAVLQNRLAGDTTRPLLSGGKDMVELYRMREQIYRDAADVRVDTTGKAPLTVASEILEIIRGRKQ